MEERRDIRAELDARLEELLPGAREHAAQVGEGEGYARALAAMVAVLEVAGVSPALREGAGR